MNRSILHINAHPGHTKQRLFSFLPPFQLFECDLKAWISENFCFQNWNRYQTISRISIDTVLIVSIYNILEIHPYQKWMTQIRLFEIYALQ